MSALGLKICAEARTEATKVERLLTGVCVIVFFQLAPYVAFSWSGHSAFTYLVIKNSGVDFSFTVEPSKRNFEDNRTYRTDGRLKWFLENDVTGLENRLVEEYLVGRFGFLNAAPLEGRLPAWQVIALYSAFPDIGIDFLKGASALQDFLLGDSQAIRHAKVKVGPVEVFEGDGSFLYFIRKSQELVKSGNVYWGLRYFGYALHYLQDLMQPYHVSPGRVWELVLFPFNREVRNLLRNAHTAVDRLLAYMLLYETERLESVIKSAAPIRITPDEQLILEAVMYSYSRFPRLHELTKKTFAGLHLNAPTIDDMKLLKGNSNFETLVSEVCTIVGTMAGLIKALLADLRVSITD